MNCLTSLCRAAKVFAAVAIVWLAQGAMALAAGPDDKKADSGTWTASYFLVILVVGLGLMLVLKATGRKDRARPAQFGD